MKKIIITVCLVILVVIGIYQYYPSAKHKQVARPAAWVSVSPVQTASLPVMIHTLGNVVASRQVAITPEIAGHVSAILFSDGEVVEKGKALLKLNDAVYRAKYQSSSARLSLSKRSYDRLRLLAKKGVVSKQELENAEANYKQAQADTSEIKALLDEMTLVAPFAGKLGERQISPGDYVTVGSPIVTLTDINQLKVQYDVPEKYLANLHNGQAVSIKSIAYPDRVFKAKVAFVSPTVNQENRSVPVYAILHNDKHQLTPGMLVMVEQSLKTKKEALMVPARSLVPVLDGEQIYKVIDGKAYVADVKIGLRQGDDVEVLEGLNKGDRVVTDGQHKLMNGMPVKIKK